MMPTITHSKIPAETPATTPMMMLILAVSFSYPKKKPLIDKTYKPRKIMMFWTVISSGNNIIIQDTKHT